MTAVPADVFYECAYGHRTAIGALNGARCPTCRSVVEAMTIIPREPLVCGGDTIDLADAAPARQYGPSAARRAAARAERKRQRRHRR